jgi:hypothetical protein
MPNPTTPLTSLYTSKINIDSNNFAPRLGMAYSFAKGTVLRDTASSTPKPLIAPTTLRV